MIQKYPVQMHGWPRRPRRARTAQRELALSGCWHGRHEGASRRSRWLWSAAKVQEESE